MKYFAELVENPRRVIGDQTFRLGQEQEVNRSTYDTLAKHEQFAVRTKDEATPAYSKTDLRELKKTGQVKLIKELGGNPADAKNEDERIALILVLQEQG